MSHESSFLQNTFLIDEFVTPSLQISKKYVLISAKDESSLMNS